jgi:hypothetical protein
MTPKFDSGIHDLAVCKYGYFCFVYYLHILDSSGCPGEKGQTFRKSKIMHGQFGFLKVHPFPPGGFFTFLTVVAHGVAWRRRRAVRGRRSKGKLVTRRN